MQSRINQAPLDEAELASKLAGIFITRSDNAMFIRGDAGLEFSAVAPAIDDGRKAGAETIAIITPRSGRR